MANANAGLAGASRNVIDRSEHYHAHHVITKLSRAVEQDSTATWSCEVCYLDV